MTLWTPAAFAAAAKPYVEKAKIAVTDRYPAMAASVQEKVPTLADVPGAIDFYLDLPEADEETLAKARKNEDAPLLLAALAEKLKVLDDWSQAKEAKEAKEAIGATAAEHEVKAGKLMFPLRVALSGRSAGPSLDDMLAILGKDESIRRIEHMAGQL